MKTFITLLCVSLISFGITAQAGTPALANLSTNPFPVKYISFSGSISQKYVLLSWTTEEVKNSTHCEIERSFDGKNFSVIGLSLDGFENGSKKEYAFKDLSPNLKHDAVAYYRLKQVGLDGTFIYSNVIAVQLDVKGNPVM